MMYSTPTAREMHDAFMTRDASYDGIFFTGVRTTGIFCRPSCPARKPKSENIEFFSTVREALFAGYRPCERCRPLNALGSHPEWVMKLLRRIEDEPTGRVRDTDVRTMGIQPERARRYFIKHFGMTFQAYSRARRLGHSLHSIREGTRLDDVILGHGYESHSGFRDAFSRTFGRPPGKSQKSDCIVTAMIESPIGPLVAGANAEGVVLLEFTDRRMMEHQFSSLRKHFRCAVVPGENPHLDALRRELCEYFDGKRKQFTVPLVFPGTPFEERVWKALLKIPYGQTRSYEDLAQTLGAAGAQRAVGRANGMNRIAIIIPCHRVINKNGQLGGYGGGLWRKQRLLDLERGVLTLT